MNLHTKIGNIPTDKCGYCPLIAYCGDSYEEPHLCCSTSVADMTIQQYMAMAQNISHEDIAIMAEKEGLVISSDDDLTEKEQEMFDEENDCENNDCENNIKKAIYSIIIARL